MAVAPLISLFSCRQPTAVAPFLVAEVLRCAERECLLTVFLFLTDFAASANASRLDEADFAADEADFATLRVLSFIFLIRAIFSRNKLANDF